MRSVVWTITSIALLSLVATSQDPEPRGGGQGGQGGGQGGRQQASPAQMVGPLLASTADADKSGDVTEKEWKDFVASVQGKEDGSVDSAKLRTSVMAAQLDINADKKVNSDDLAAAFKALDRDGDGTLKAEELAPAQPGGGRQPGGQGGGGGGQGGQRGEGGAQPGARPAGRPNRWAAEIGRLMARSADANTDNEVTADEWKEFASGVTNDKGDVDRPALSAKLIAAQPKPPAEGEGQQPRRGGGMLTMLDRALDPEGKGVTTASLDKIFGDLDKDGDKALSAEELQPRRRR
jgi:Ca2+-binding EF-hand superfamily protein